MITYLPLTYGNSITIMIHYGSYYKLQSDLLFILIYFNLIVNKILLL